MVPNIWSSDPQPGVAHDRLEAVGVAGHPVRHVAAVGAAHHADPVGVDVRAGQHRLGHGHDVGERPGTPVVVAAGDELLPVAGGQRRVRQQHGVAAGRHQPRVPPPGPGVPAAHRAAVHPQQQRRGAVGRRALRQHEPGPDRLAVVGGRLDLGQPARHRQRHAGAVQGGRPGRAGIGVSGRSGPGSAASPPPSAARTGTGRPAPGSGRCTRRRHRSRGSPGRCATSTPEHRPPAAVVGGEVHGPGIGRPGGLGGPPGPGRAAGRGRLRPAAPAPLTPSRTRVRSGGRSGVVCVSRWQTMNRPSGETRGPEKLYSGALSSTWRFPVATSIMTSSACDCPAGMPQLPAGDHRGAVRGQLERLVVERAARLRGQVTQPGELPGPGRVTGLVSELVRVDGRTAGPGPGRGHDPST